MTNQPIQLSQQQLEAAVLQALPQGGISIGRGKIDEEGFEQCSMDNVPVDIGAGEPVMVNLTVWMKHSLAQGIVIDTDKRPIQYTLAQAQAD